MGSTAVIDQRTASSLLLTSVRDLLEQSGTSIPANLGPQTILFGPDAILDSLGLVTLIIDVEQRLEAEHGVSVALATDKAMSERQSPFRTVQTMTEYICRVVGEHA